MEYICELDFNIENEKICGFNSILFKLLPNNNKIIVDTFVKNFVPDASNNFYTTLVDHFKWILSYTFSVSNFEFIAKNDHLNNIFVDECIKYDIIPPNNYLSYINQKKIYVNFSKYQKHFNLSF